MRRRVSGSTRMIQAQPQRFERCNATSTPIWDPMDEGGCTTKCADRRDLAVAYACTGVPNWERRALPLAYPAVTRVIDRFLDITATTAAQSEAQVRTVFDAVAKRLSDDRPYLCGDRFTAADLTFAALAASVLMPPEYGVPLPQPGELPVAMAEVVREFRAHPAGAHALAMYRDERR